MEFWGNEEHNPIVEDDFKEDTVYSEDEDFNGKYKDSDDIYSDELGYKYSVVKIKNKIR